MDEKSLIKKAVETNMPDINQVRANCLNQSLPNEQTAKHSLLHRSIPALSCAVIVVIALLISPVFDINQTDNSGKLGSTFNEPFVAVNDAAPNDNSDSKNAKKANTATNNSAKSNNSNSEKSKDAGKDKSYGSDVKNPESIDDSRSIQNNPPAVFSLDPPSLSTFVFNDPDESLNTASILQLNSIDKELISGAFNEIDPSELSEIKNYILTNSESMKHSVVGDNDAVIVSIKGENVIYRVCYFPSQDSDYFLVAKNRTKKQFIQDIKNSMNP